MNKVLIISPHFAPVNSADMHRVRHMLFYIEKYNWKADIVTVYPNCIDSYSTDNLLLKLLPKNFNIHYVKAFSYKITRKIGLGSLSLRSYFFYKMAVNAILKENKFDLIFFSTTAFHVMALGPYWKRKFSIPFVLDIQDPWRSDFYLDQPKDKRPPKFWFSYLLDKYLEAKTVPFADGIVSVSKGYIDVFQSRYSNFNSLTTVLPFSGFEKDFDIIDNISIPDTIKLNSNFFNILYVGRGGHDLSFSVEIFFNALLRLKKKNKDIFDKIRISFIGTSYAAKGLGIKTIEPIAIKMGLGDVVSEITDRQEYFLTLKLLTKANLLFIPGSSDNSYTASKIYPYILSKKPIIACFHEKSSVVTILNKTNPNSILTFNSTLNYDLDLINNMYSMLLKKVDQNYIERYNFDMIKPYLADSMTEKICDFFNSVKKIN
jgi:hypothetical protein